MKHNTQMIKKFACILLFSAAVTAAFSQESKRSSARPDIPGTFVLELGVNRALERPTLFRTGLWGSRTVNLYYQYDIRILQSRFSFVPGIGLSLERYKFTNNRIVRYAGNTTDSVTLANPAQLGLSRVQKSQLITNYLEVPLELRYSSNPEDPARSFKASIGARIGYLYDAFTKVKYREEGEVRKLKNKQDYNLNPFRYGVTARVGVGNFSIFGYYNLTPLFREGKGFYERNSPRDFNTFTVGISLASF
jgi:hypothetical protein